MKKKNEKTIIKQVSLNLNFLGSFIVEIDQNPEKTIKDFFEDWQKSVGWDQKDNYSLFNQGVIITHLYGILIYPKEIFWEDIPKIKISNINNDKWGNFDILEYRDEKDSSEINLKFIIRKLRNSLSHGDFVINNNMDIIFNDLDKFSIKFKIGELQKFTNELRRIIISTDLG